MLVSRTVKESELVKCGASIGPEVVNCRGVRVVIPTFEIRSPCVFELVDKIKSNRDKLVEHLVESGHDCREGDVEVFVVAHEDGVVRAKPDGELAVIAGMYYLHKGPLEGVEIGF